MFHRWERCRITLTMLIVVTSLYGEQCSSENIHKQNVANLGFVGLMFDNIHAKVSNKGSKIKKA